MTLVRGAVALSAGLAVALAGSSLVFVEVGASPAPGTVLAAAQRDARRQEVTLTADATVSAPAPGADASVLVRHHRVEGVARGGAADWTVTSGAATFERLEVAGQPGLWVRGAADRAALADAKWAHASDGRAVETAISGSAVAGDQLSVALLITRLESPAVFGDLVGSARQPRRRDHDAHHLQVDLDRTVVAGSSGAAVDDATAVVNTDDQGHPRRVVLHVRTGSTLIDVSYAPAWAVVGPIEAPAAAAVVAEL